MSGNVSVGTSASGTTSVVINLAGKTSTQVDNAPVNVDTAAPTINSIEPGNGTGGWAAIDCS
jgi:hypothetical protein